MEHDALLLAERDVGRLLDAVEHNSMPGARR